jgi:sodium bicarbonate transporter 10
MMGIPWFVAATVLSINHVNSLKLESECAAPGEKAQFLGVRYAISHHIVQFKCSEYYKYCVANQYSIDASNS